MESFEDYGQGLTVDKGGALVRNPHGMFHLHPHYELLICTYPPTISTILCDQRVTTDYPIALLVSPFVTHYAASVVDDSCPKRRTVVYFGEEVVNDCGLPVGSKDLLGGGAACIYDLRGYFGRMREYTERIEQLTDGWEARQLLGLMLHLMWSNRERRHIVMTRPDDYILKVIDYVSANLDRKLTADAIAADFFVSRDKLKKGLQTQYVHEHRRFCAGDAHEPREGVIAEKSSCERGHPAMRVREQFVFFQALQGDHRKNAVAVLEVGGEDLGGAGRPLERVSPYPPNLPDPPRTSPKSTRLCSAKIWFALFWAGALGGSFLSVWEAERFCKVRLRA